MPHRKGLAGRISSETFQYRQGMGMGMEDGMSLRLNSHHPVPDPIPWS
jgi:hypothetical protein